MFCLINVDINQTGDTHALTGPAQYLQIVANSERESLPGSLNSFFLPRGERQLGKLWVTMTRGRKERQNEKREQRSRGGKKGTETKIRLMERERERAAAGRSSEGGRNKAGTKFLANYLEPLKRLSLGDRQPELRQFAIPLLTPVVLPGGF